MSTPWSTFPQVLTTQVGYIAAASVIAGSSPTPIGTGPFTYGGAAADGSLSFPRNEAYWRDGLPHLDAVRIVAIPEATDRLVAVLEGTADLVAIDEPRQLSRLDDLRDDAELVVVDDRNGERPKVNIAFETGRPPFDHISARRAVALATDREELLETVFDGEGTVSRSMLSDASPWFSDHTAPAADLDRSRRRPRSTPRRRARPSASRSSSRPIRRSPTWRRGGASSWPGPASTPRSSPSTTPR